MIRDNTGSRKVCEGCGKVFYPSYPTLYTYKIQKQVGSSLKLFWYCRYNCFRQAQKENEKDKVNNWRV